MAAGLEPAWACALARLPCFCYLELGQPQSYWLHSSNLACCTSLLHSTATSSHQTGVPALRSTLKMKNYGHVECHGIECACLLLLCLEPKTPDIYALNPTAYAITCGSIFQVL